MGVLTYQNLSIYFRAVNGLERGLVRELALAIAAKLILLALIWRLFFAHPPLPTQGIAPAAGGAASAPFTILSGTEVRDD